MVFKIYRGKVTENLNLTSGQASFGLFDRISAFLLAISPILQHYIGLYENAGFTVLLFVLPLLLLQFLQRGWTISVKPEIVPLLLFEFYSFVVRSSSLSRLLYVGFFIILYLLISNGYVNYSLFFTYSLRICIIAVILLYVQYIAYYIFGSNLSLRPLHLLVSQDVIWVRSANSSRTPSLFRRAAFFLEPSHMFLYMFPVLSILLISPGMDRKRMRLSVIVTSGLLLSTSGFGIVASILLWSVYFALYRSRNAGNSNRTSHRRRSVSSRTIVTLFVLFLFFVFLYVAVPFFTKSVDRILDFTAIDGRVRLARNYVRQISGSRVWVGQAGVVGDLDFNLSGFYATYIKWGIIGIVLTYWYYLQGLFKLKNAYFWITVIILGISYFTAHTHGTFYMLYYVLFLSMGYHTSFQKDNDISL